MGFHEKLLEYKACVQFLEVIRPKKQRRGQSDNRDCRLSKLKNLEPDDRRDYLEEHQEKHCKEDQDNGAGAQQEEKEK